MNIHNLFFKNEDTLKYVQTGGYNIKSRMLRLVAEGDIENIYLIAKEYSDGLIILFKKLNLDDIRQMTFYIYAQISAVATNSGLDDREAVRIKEGYYLSIEHTLKKDVFAELIRELIIDFTYAVYRKKQYPTYSPLIQSVIDYINDNLEERITVSQIAEHFYCSESTISHRFSNEVGISVLEYILQRKIAISKIMICQNIPLSQIASQIGFSSQSHYSKAFRNITGKPPLKWKKESLYKTST